MDGYYEGPVVDNKDPRKLGRVRVNIPGYAEPTGWAMPIGMPGAGGKKRGTWVIPPVGSEVGVFFKNGDPDHPRYLPGPVGEGEAPDEVDDSSVDEATEVYVLNMRRWKLVCDDRMGKARMAIEDKKTGDMYEIDGVRLGLKLKSTAAMSIECDGAVDIRGSSITLNGRRLAPNKKPI